MKKNVLVLITIVLVGIVFLGLFITFVFGSKMSRNSIIGKYRDNVQLFDGSLEELEENSIYFNRESVRWKYSEIVITIHETSNNGKINVVTVSKPDYFKYNKTIGLMNDLGIARVSKDENNISYQFNSMIGFSQEIVKLGNEERYIRSGYKIVYKKSLGNGWYYVECE